MNELLTQLQDHVFIITLNRVNKHNAFDDKLIKALQEQLNKAIADNQVRVILLKANGPHFSAGADLSWMQRMAQFNEEENLVDALVLARLMKTLYECPKPTIAAVQGGAFGGGAGLVAACDIAIASTEAKFCFSEVKLGLIPAVISPYVVKAIGERAAKWLFMSAQPFDAEQAKQLNLIQYCVQDCTLANFALTYARQIANLAPKAVADCKALIHRVCNRPVTDELIQETAVLIAQKRVSKEGQKGLQAFLKKEQPQWN
ncbi:enoyl CoA hydratase/isomerase (crotonase) [Legionella beliardensis]|uniref:Enoyl CoA hydratase/isomerase (Crotonase) n=1 Tax=Legionella beliardensis TaxID=91822 RepID=A0A378I3L2_9GAMM|nr:enoyl-CoA hydratase-related protein [Legionella beliardensis]STX29583.1 enoyl CoA hydratase/isomerase (crotonase) [Legionella beliardensis]